MYRTLAQSDIEISRAVQLANPGLGFTVPTIYGAHQIIVHSTI